LTCLIAIAELDEISAIKYEAESPDEVALCNFAKQEGFVLIERKKNIDVKLQIMDQEAHYTLLTTLEFSSDRRRSSVIVRTPEGSPQTKPNQIKSNQTKPNHSSMNE